MAGETTVQVLTGFRATPELLYAVTRIEVGGPTVEELAAATGVTVISVFPG